MKNLFKFKIVVKAFIFILLLISVGSTSNVFAKTKSVPKVSIKSIADISVNVNQGTKYTLPSTVTAKMSNRSVKKAGVTWNTKKVSTSKAGKSTFSGTIKGYSKKVKLNLTVVIPMSNQEKVLLAQLKSTETTVLRNLQYVKNDKCVYTGDGVVIADSQKVQKYQNQLDLIQSEIKVLKNCNAKSDYRKELLLAQLKHEISVAQQNIALARVDNYVRVYGDTGWEWIPDEIKIQEYQNEINNVQAEIDYVQAELNDEK